MTIRRGFWDSKGLTVRSSYRASVPQDAVNVAMLQDSRRPHKVEILAFLDICETLSHKGLCCSILSKVHWMVHVVSRCQSLTIPLDRSACSINIVCTLKSLHLHGGRVAQYLTPDPRLVSTPSFIDHNYVMLGTPFHLVMQSTW